MQSPPPSHHFLSHRSKYSPWHPVLTLNLCTIIIITDTEKSALNSLNQWDCPFTPQHTWTTTEYSSALVVILNFMAVKSHWIEDTIVYLLDNRILCQI